MVREVTIKNYKSIRELGFELGRVNVIIGENGTGKSNILEALLLAAAAFQRKLDDEFLINRGIRVTDPQAMKSGFDRELQDNTIYIELKLPKDYQAPEGSYYRVELERKGEDYRSWDNVFDDLSGEISYKEFHDLYIMLLKGMKEKIYEKSKVPEASSNEYDDDVKMIEEKLKKLNEINEDDINRLDEHKNRQEKTGKIMGLENFLVYYPNHRAMMSRDRESNIKPLGIYGDGLIDFLSLIKKQYPVDYEHAVNYMKLLGWYSKMEITANDKDELLNGDRFQIYDKYLEDGLKYFDQRTVNEGFLFILFYYLLFTSKLTPKFFAVDNVDASLNPRLCVRLMEDIVRFTIKFNKQTILTTHNPALLDGLDLFDDEQRLFVAYRNADGETKLKRVKPQVNHDKITIKNSEAFIKGYFGALPKNF